MKKIIELILRILPNDLLGTLSFLAGCEVMTRHLLEDERRVR